MKPSQTDQERLKIERRDQEQFDADVERVGKKVLLILAGLATFAALLMSIVALSSSPTQRIIYVVPTKAQTSATTTPTAQRQTSATTTQPQTISLFVAPSWKKGPDGKLHDAFSQTTFHVTVGVPLYLKITNKDTALHGISSPNIGVNIIVRPGTHIYKLLVKSPGTFIWFCPFPCDSFSMSHMGYMQGKIIASYA